MAPDWHALTERSDHRPYPLPDAPWVMTMSWIDLLFAHARVDPDAVARILPDGLEPDLYDGEAWLGVVPFRMENVRPRGVSWLPWVSAFCELNVRTYVRGPDGRPGVWFLSLDAASRLAVRGARATFHLPYYDARMSCTRTAEGWVAYACNRTHRGAPPARFEGRYRPVGPPRTARPGTLEHFLVERYCLYAADRRGRLYRGEIHHPPWPLQDAEAEIDANTVAAAAGFEDFGPPEHLHFAARIDVVGWAPQRL